MRAFQWYLGGDLGPILEPKPANLPWWPSFSCKLQFVSPTKNKLVSSSADPAQCWNNTINSFMVWTLRLYRFSAGCGRLIVLCPDDMAPCPKVILLTRRRLYRGASCTSSSTFQRRRGNRTSPGRTNLVWRHGGYGAGATLIAAFATAARRTMRISAMHQQCIVH
jgi:hypothetical protein